MNQTKKRLTIINLAISITDIEAIQLQVLKLGLLKTDDKIREILSMLNEQNYAQAQGLISEYIESPNETILQRISQEETLNNKDQDIIDEFELFTETTQEADSQKEVNYDNFLDTAIKPKESSTESINYDTLLNVDADEILPDNIELDIAQKSKDTFFEQTSTTIVENDDFFEDNQTTNAETIQDEKKDEDFSKEVQDNTAPDTPSVTETHSEEEGNTLYDPIPYIDQKFNHLCTQYPPIELTENRYFSVENWLLQISTEGYTEIEIETHIKEANELSKTNKSEASQLLLATASTKSKYAQFSLARALYTGNILQKNVSQSVEIIKQLAVTDDYPEAICDLAQFYEQGLIVTKDKKKAESLYKEAMDLGIQRAVKHYDRVHKANKSLLSAFRK